MTSHEAVARKDDSRRINGRSSRKTANLPPLLAAIAAGAFAITDEQFEAALDDLRRELAPSTVLESLFVALIVEAAARLRRAAERREEIEAGDPKWTRYRNSAERSFWKALNALMRGRRPARAGKPADPPCPGPAEPVEEPEAVALPATPVPPRPVPVPVAAQPNERRPAQESEPVAKAPILGHTDSTLIPPPADFSFADLFAIPPMPTGRPRRKRPALVHRRA